MFSWMTNRIRGSIKVDPPGELCEILIKTVNNMLFMLGVHIIKLSVNLAPLVRADIFQVLGVDGGCFCFIM